MRALRRSIKGEKDKSNSASFPKAAVAILPPKKVIRALYDYDAQTEDQLSFSKGDFFHVIAQEDNPQWYEACNPALPDARGLVPVKFFQVLGRTERDSAQSDGGRPPTATKTPDHDSGYSEASMPSTGMSGLTGLPPGQRLSKSVKPGSMIYGIVMYDFAAERTDELEAKAGEAIIVIAQSNPEWFVAKPIGRLGGPGLIPVSFVEIRDMTSGQAIGDPGDALKKAGVPKVEEWKKMAAEYKNSSITLGKFEGGVSPGQSIEQGMDRMSLQQSGGRQSNQSASQHGSQPTNQQQVQQNPYGSQSNSQLFAPIEASIPRYCFAEDKYWFVIEAMLEDGRNWELSRYYEDFYDFQIALLTEFPAEAGNTGTQKRSLPYMPGPVNYVTDAITEGRLHNLDAYVKNLLNQPPYISRCNLVKQFFAPREGDYEITQNANGEEYRLSQGSQLSSTESPADGSRQSSRNNLTNNNYSGLSATPRQMSNGYQDVQQQQQQYGDMKVKAYYGSDLIAFMVPANIDYEQLHQRIYERRGDTIFSEVGDPRKLQLYYKDGQTRKQLRMRGSNDMRVALQRNEKLLIYVWAVESMLDDPDEFPGNVS